MADKGGPIGVPEPAIGGVGQDRACRGRGSGMASTLADRQRSLVEPDAGAVAQAAHAAAVFATRMRLAA